MSADELRPSDLAALVRPARHPIVADLPSADGLAEMSPSGRSTHAGTEQDYEYHGLMAQAWDLLRGDTSTWHDRPFFLAALRRFGEPVLDVGCGTGRLLLDYLAQGVDIDGLDNSPEMLEICRAKAAGRRLEPRLYAQAMENLDLARRYRTICIPSSSFQVVIDLPDARRAVQHFHDHLLPGGALVMPFIVMGRPGRPLEESWTREASRPADGTLVRRHAWSRYDPETQLEHTRDVYELLRDGQVVAVETHARSPATRAYSLEQATDLLTAAGFTIDSVVGGFSDRRYNPGSDELFTVTAVRPAGRGQ